MDLRSLKHVIVLAQHLSYTKAAQELCITQPALSRSIQALEREAKIKLFDRDRGGVHLTTVGRDFVKRATQLLRDADDLSRILHRGANADTGEVAFGLGPLAAQATLPSVLPETFTLKPDLRVKVMVRGVDALLPALINEEIEFIISAETEALKTMSLQSDFIGWIPTSLIVRAEHPIFKTTQKKDMGNYPLISPGTFRHVDNWPTFFKKYLSGPLHIIEDYGVASRITQVSDAIWLSSSFAAAPEIRAGRLAVIPVPKQQKPFKFKLVMYSLKRRSLSPAANMLKEKFKKTLSEMNNIL